VQASDIVSVEQTWLFGQENRFVRSWRGPEVLSNRVPKSLVLGVIHGLGDHSGRFDRLGKWFARRGVRVYSFDHRGHGKSPGRRMAIVSYE
jgi:alpha-beta hydrolase superfamily lysophospholipase